MSADTNLQIELKPIGRIRTGFTSIEDCPSSGRFNDKQSTIELFPEFVSGLNNMHMASHIFVLYWFDRADRSALTRRGRKPGESDRGIFVSRAPNRPNPIAVSVAKLIKHEGNTLVISGLDCLDGAQIVDIKPYCPDEDRIEDARIDWTFP